MEKDLQSTLQQIYLPARFQKSVPTKMYASIFACQKKIKGISAIGTIEEVIDMSIKEDFWHTTWRMYYHKGAHNPDYTILRFRSKYLHCWGNLGINNFGHGVNSCDKE